MIPRAKAFEFQKFEADPQTGTFSFYYGYIFEDGGHEDYIETVETHKPFSGELLELHNIKQALIALHFALGTSYFKMYEADDLHHPYQISRSQADFWNTIYTQGMGEYYYVNNLNFVDRVEFDYSEDATEDISGSQPQKEKVLLLHGGGKDSIVSAEALKKAGIEFDLFAMNPQPVQEAVAHVMGTSIQSVKRSIDTQIIEHNKAGDVYNGHVPFVTIVSCIAVLYAQLYGYTDIVLSNEKSASYGNVEYKGLTVNHQWDKSDEHEKLFSNYVITNISSQLRYFSFLRPLHEIKIAQIFSRYSQYFTVFSSSNSNFKLDATGKQSRWDVDYSKGKVEFVFALLSAFLPKSEIMRIFGENIYSRSDRLHIFKQLLGKEHIKPLDCVGTPEEMIVAMSMASEGAEYSHDPIMQYFQSDVLPQVQNMDELKADVFSFGDESSLPSHFQKALHAIL